MYPVLRLGSLNISTYFLVISIATVIGEVWFIRRAGRKGLSRLKTIDLALVLLIGGLAGARLFHIFYEEPAYYREHPLMMLELWNGGFVYWGGIMGAAVAGFLFCLKREIPFLMVADALALPTSLGYAIGRMACFLNGCCYGVKCTLPWAVFMDGEWRHPTQLYASFWEFGVLGLLLFFERRYSRVQGRVFGVWLIGHSMGRILMEHFRDDPRGPILSGFSIGTWISFAAIGLGLVLIEPFATRAAEAVIPRS